MKLKYVGMLLIMLMMAGCTETENVTNTSEEVETQSSPVATAKANVTAPIEAQDKKEEATKTEEVKTEPAEEEIAEEHQEVEEPQITKEHFPGYTEIVVNGGDLSGYRQANVVVDIGFGDREYWAFTNEHGQLVRVIAEKIILQDDRTEPVLSSGRYYADEAKVPGVESAQLDEGHIIADSLGGVSNAYNITPQNSTLNRHGDQAYMEEVIRKAGGATDFEAIITYPNANTQIPSHYQYTYTVRGNQVVDSFDNVNPDEVNAAQGLTQAEEAQEPVQEPVVTQTEPAVTTPAATGNVASVDTDGNGQVTIKEAKAAGYQMPITRDHWLYQYMRDNDNDGMVGE